MSAASFVKKPNENGETTETGVSVEKVRLEGTINATRASLSKFIEEVSHEFDTL